MKCLLTDISVVVQVVIEIILIIIFAVGESSGPVACMSSIFRMMFIVSL